MKVYEIIITDIVFCIVIFLLAGGLSNIFPGRHRASSNRQTQVTSLEVKRSARRLMQAVYIIALSLIPDLTLPLILEKVALTPKHAQFIRLEATSLDGWLIFWGAAALLHAVEFLLRLSYRKKELLFPVSTLLAALIRVTLLILTGMWVAHFVFGWQSTPILVSATMLTAVVGYTARGTLGDLLSGVSLHLSRSVLPAEWISLPTLFLEGEVLSTNWRETRLRTTSGHIQIIPNSVMATTPFHNMSWPDSVRRHAMEFIVSPCNSPEDVERALLEVVADNPKVLQIPKAPQVIIVASLEFGIQYRLRFWSNTYYDRGSLEGGIYKAAWHGFKKYDIKYLSPNSTVLLKRKREV